MYIPTETATESHMQSGGRAALSGAASKIADLLRQSGHRLTPRRRAIIEAIIDADAASGHFDADCLSARVRASGISRATVYRTMPVLVECGAIRHAYRDGRTERYELGCGTTHHDHLLCTECGKVIEFRDERIEKIQAEICRRRHFRTMDHRLIIRGLCSDCARALNRRKQPKTREKARHRETSSWQ